MPFFEIGFTTTATADAAAVAAIRPGTNDGIRVLEIGWYNNAATASRVALFRNTNASYAASTSTSVGQRTDPSSYASEAVIDTAWTSAPTISSTAMLRRGVAGGSIGSCFVWSFQYGLYLRVSTPTDILVLWNNSGGAAAISVGNGWVAWEE
jgi:hypothetical protein